MTFAGHIESIDLAVRDHLGGVTVEYRSQHADPVLVDGMFDSHYVFIDQGSDGVEQTGPALFVRLADLPVHPDDDEPTIIIGEKTYRVVERKPDGIGGILLRLHLAVDD